jgi:hypothetical protein
MEISFHNTHVGDNQKNCLYMPSSRGENGAFEEIIIGKFFLLFFWHKVKLVFLSLD